jgi:hypothetical protein
MPDMGESHVADSAERVKNDSGCICGQASSSLYAKSDRPQVDHQIVGFAPAAITPVLANYPRLTVPLPNRERPFYLTDSFYNLSPQRGPPVL